MSSSDSIDAVVPKEEVTTVTIEVADEPQVQEDFRRMSTKEIVGMSIAAFRRHVVESPAQTEPDFTTLEIYRRALKRYITTNTENEEAAKLVGKARTKFSSLEHVMRIRVKAGVGAKRRVSGTGERKVVSKEYRDTASNRAMERVGTTYDKVVWEGAEFEDYKRNIRTNKRKRVAAVDGVPRKKGIWIDAFAQAKLEFPEIPANKWVAACKTVTDPENADQVLRNKVYLRAMEIKTVIKAQRDAEAEAAASAVSTTAY
jgi:hypothetical protein